ncbi:hypothetical protein [Acidovorax delafieldii]|uniref:hypothetical protein n=1 Tax=Acidovorax delafieldii TaxID=47920 RepID=UPI003ED059D3
MLELRHVTPIAFITGLLTFVGSIEGLTVPFLYQFGVSFSGGMVISGLYFWTRKQGSSVTFVALMFIGFLMMNVHLLTAEDKFQSGAVALGLLAGMLIKRGWRRLSARAQPAHAIE